MFHFMPPTGCALDAIVKTRAAIDVNCSKSVVEAVVSEPIAIVAGTAGRADSSLADGVSRFVRRSQDEHTC